MSALAEAKIRFQVAGMSAAVLQGAPVATFDADLWVDLPERQYVRLLTIGQKLGANILARTVLVLSDDTRVDFLFRVDGIASFATEWRRAVPMIWAGQRVKVLRLDRVIQSKEFVGRPKDIAQLPVLKDILASQKIQRLR
ncbi:MAG: hypothetical protein WCF18_15555 [Chthoniobacteraceae bacterium]